MFTEYLRKQQKVDVYQKIVEFLEPFIEHDIGPTKTINSSSGLPATVDPDVIFEVQRELKKTRFALVDELSSVDETKI
jgi:hypothetical protein